MLRRFRFLKKKNFFTWQNLVVFLKKKNFFKNKITFFYFLLFKSLTTLLFNNFTYVYINFLKLKFFKIIFFFKQSNLFFKKYITQNNFLKFLIYLYISFFFKKIFWLAYICNKINTSVQFLHIKNVLYIYRVFFKKYWNFCFTYFQINGLIFFFKGKLGTSGNKRKKKFLLKYGLVNSTNFVYNIDKSTHYIITSSGLTNFNLILYY